MVGKQATLRCQHCVTCILLSLKYITKYIIFVKWFYFLRTGNNAVENRSGLMRGERDAVVEVMTDAQLRR